MRSRTPKNNFVAGELTERLLGRDDLAQYQQGCLRVENFTVMPHGGAIRRVGSRFVEETKESEKRSRLIPFQYSTEEAYVIEAGDLYFRFYAKGGQVLDVLGDPLEVATPYTVDDVPLLQYAQTADVMYIVHPNHPPYKLSRTSATSFSLNQVEFSKGRAPVGVFNQDPDNYVTANTGSVITMTADTFTADDIGRVFYVRDEVNGNAAFYSIDSLDGTTPATKANVTQLDLIGTTPSGADTDRWAKGLFSDTEGCNVVTFHEGRLFYGGFKRAPEMTWFSVSDDFDNFEIQSPDPNLTDADNADNAIQRRLLSDKVDEVRWAVSAGEKFAIGTSGAEWNINPGADDILTPASAVRRRLTKRGSAQIIPAVIDNNVFFIQRNNTRLREFKFSLDDDTYISRDTAILAEHLIRAGGGVREMVYQQDPDSILWIVRNDGVLLGWTIEREQEVIGAHRQLFGGNYEGEAARVESVATIPGSFALTARDDITGVTSEDLSTYMTNLGAETGDLTGWTQTSGTWTATTAGAGQPSPSEGSYMFRCGSTTEAILTQTVDLGNIPGLNRVLIDEGRTQIDASIMVARESTNGFLSVELVALDENDNEIYTIYETNRDDGVDPYAPPSEDTWYDLGGVFTLPRLTRKIKVNLIGNPTGHTTTGSAGQLFDDMVFELNQTPIVYDDTYTSSEDQLWVIVARTIGTTTRRYVEYLGPQFNPEVRRSSSLKDRTDAMDAAEFMDSLLELNVPIYIDDISSASPGVVTATAHGLVDNDTVRFRNVKGDLEDLLDQKRFVVDNATTDTLTLKDIDTDEAIDTTAYTYLANSSTAMYKDVTELSGLDHLEGETVQILADGAIHPEATVTGGSVTLQRPASIVRVGLGYLSLLETFPLVAPSRIGTSQARPGVSPLVDALFHNTLGGSIAAGTEDAERQELVSRSSGDFMDRSPPIVTGVEQFAIGGSWDELPTVVVEQDQPLPMTLLALYPTVERHDR